ncbi:MAG: hypothetical protein ACFFCW_19140 [Candidatus Hodarchaeota archaeon]
MGRRRKVTDEQFLELYNKGFGDYEIARKLGVSRTSIWTKRRRLKLKPIGRKKNQ